MQSASSASARALFQHHPSDLFRRPRAVQILLPGRRGAVGWQVYALSNRAAALGLVGLYGYLFAGVGFVRRNPAILVSRCYWAGATALLPIYARDILHTGLGGLGVLRGAPAVGALLMAAALTRRPISRRVGMRMLQAVIVFGAAAVLFALSILALARRAAPTRGAGGSAR